MTLWIKVCGLTSEAAVDAAVEAGVDAIGFVFAPSKRQVTAQQAARLANGARAVTKVAVMQHPSQTLLDAVWSEFRPDVLQTDVEDLPDLRIPDGLRVMPVIRNGNAMREPLPQRVLFEGLRSGVGETADWTTAARLSAMTQLVLAGGLTASNVASAIATVRPFGVDVSSGVESAPGIKDPLKIHEFVRIARTAGAMR